MLEWLKTILGDGYTEEVDKKVSDEIGKSFVSRVDFNALNDTKKTLETTIADRDKQLDDLKKVDAAGLQAEIARLQGENKTAKEKYDTDIAAMQFDNALASALQKENPRNIKAVKALLEMDGLKFADGKIDGLSEQIETIRKDNDYLFETTPAVGAVKGTGGKGTSVQLDGMTYSEQVAYMETHPNAKI